MNAQRLWLLMTLLPLTCANIPVKYKVTLSCNQSSPFYTGCLRGMTCEEDLTCSKPAVKIVADSLFFLEATHLSRRQAQPPVPSESTEPQISAPAPAPAPAAEGPVTTDGTCGAANGGTICGDWPQGGCCSLYGVSDAPLKGKNTYMLRLISSVATLPLIAVMAVNRDHALALLKLQCQGLLLHQSWMTLACLTL